MPIWQQAPLNEPFAQRLINFVKSSGNNYPPDSFFSLRAATTRVVADIFAAHSVDPKGFPCSTIDDRAWCP
jgi:hypothetical protein